jgi:hypothetical protein
VGGAWALTVGIDPHWPTGRRAVDLVGSRSSIWASTTLNSLQYLGLHLLRCEATQEPQRSGCVGDRAAAFPALLHGNSVKRRAGGGRSRSGAGFWSYLHSRASFTPGRMHDGLVGMQGMVPAMSMGRSPRRRGGGRDVSIVFVADTRLIIRARNNHSAEGSTHRLFRFHGHRRPPLRLCPSSPCLGVA